MLNVAALQQFLRSIGAPLGAAGVAPHALAPLEQCAAALDPFRPHDLGTLADLLRRADEARRSGFVPLVEVPTVAPLSKTARELGEQTLELASASDERAGELEHDLNKNRHELQTALSALAEQFGIAVKCTEVPNWSALIRGRAILNRLKQSVTSAEAYADADATADVARLVALGEPVLKALAVESKLTKVKGAKLADELLAATTGHARPTAKKPRASKAKAPAVDPAAVAEGRAALARIKQAVTSADAYASESASADVARLLALGAPVLKALAGENNLTTKAKGAKLADELLLAVTGHARPRAAKPRASKSKAPAVDPAAVAELVTVFKEKAASVEQNPYAVSDAEVEELVGKLKQLPAKTQQEVASTVTGKKITKTDDAVLRLRGLLVGVRQKLDSQNS